MKFVKLFILLFLLTFCLSSFIENNDLSEPLLELSKVENNNFLFQVFHTYTNFFRQRIEEYLSREDFVNFFYAAGKNTNLKIFFHDESIVDFESLPFYFIRFNRGSRRDHLLYKQCRLFFPFSEYDNSGDKLFDINNKPENTKEQAIVLFDALKLFPSHTRHFNIGNKKYLFMHVGLKKFNLYSIGNEDLKILIQDQDTYFHDEIPIRWILSMYLGKYGFCEYFDLETDKDFLLLEKSLHFSKTFLCKLLYFWFEFRLKYKKYMVYEPFEYLLPEIDHFLLMPPCLRWFSLIPAYLFELFVGNFLRALPIYLETQIYFTSILIEYPHFIFLTAISSVFTTTLFDMYWHVSLKNNGEFSFNKIKYFYFAFKKYHSKNLTHYFRNFLSIYFLLTIYYFFFKFLYQTFSEGEGENY